MALFAVRIQEKELQAAKMEHKVAGKAAAEVNAMQHSPMALLDVGGTPFHTLVGTHRALLGRAGTGIAHFVLATQRCSANHPE